MNQKRLGDFIFIVIIGIVFGFALQFARAWSEPTVAPPDGNIGAPITPNEIGQTKSGNLTITTKLTAKQFCLSNGCISTWSEFFH